MLFQLKYGSHNLRLLPVSTSAILGNIFCVAGAPFNVTPMNPPSWSLTYELAFYLIVTLFVSPLRTWGVLVVCVVALTWRTPWFPLDLWGAFALGIAAFLWKENILFAAVIASLAVFQVGREQGALYAAVGLASALLIVSGVDVRNRRLASLLSWLGAISYSLYLTHVPIGIYLQRILFDRFLAAELPGGIARDSGLLLACLAVAFVFFRFIEKPSHEFAKRMGTDRRRPKRLDAGGEDGAAIVPQKPPPSTPDGERLDYPFTSGRPGGEGGIRTHGTLSGTPDFESGTIDHSATSPERPSVAHASEERRKT